MRMKWWSGFVLLSGVCVAADTVHPLDVKPGLWESVTTVETSGMPPIPPDLLAKMTPQQKAMIESRIKGNKTTVNDKQCVTREDLDKGLNWGNPKTLTCKHTVVTSTSTKQELRLECETKGFKSSGTVRIEALDPEHVKVTSQITTGDGAHTMTSHVTGAARWAGATCPSDAHK